MDTDLASDEAYSPTVPGEYTWPLQGVTGYYSTIIAGALPPLDCASSVPAGTALLGCFADSSADRLLDSDLLVRAKQGPGGMTAKVKKKVPGIGDEVVVYGELTSIHWKT